jgi:hypothetical protein
MRSCLSAQIHFWFLKGLGSFKKNFKIGGNVEEYKAYPLIPLTPPPPVPLDSTFKGSDRPRGGGGGGGGRE